MIEIDRNVDYSSHGYRFRNFINLDMDTLKKILFWRNHVDVRKWMYSNEIIPLDNHLAYVASLHNRADAYYWLVYDPDGDPIGVTYVTSIKKDEDCGELGYYAISGTYGDGFSFVKECFYFYFHILQFKRFYGSVDADNVQAYLIDVFLGCQFTSSKTIESICSMKKLYYVCDSLTPEDFDSNYEKTIVEYIKFVKNENRKLH